MGHRTPRTGSASTDGPVCPKRIWTQHLQWPRRTGLQWPWRTGTQTWVRSWPRPTCIYCRTCIPHHASHGREGTRIYGTTSGHRQRYYVVPPQTQQPPPYLNLMKRFANWNACYSCGFDVADSHTSQMCPQHLRMPDHDCYFTDQNAQQYVDAGYGCSSKTATKNDFTPDVTVRGNG